MFYVLTGETIVRSLVHIVAPDGGAQSVATILINTYSPPASNTVVFIFIGVIVCLVYGTCWLEISSINPFNVLILC